MAVTDVHYLEQGARGAVVLAEAWADGEPCEEQVAVVPSVAPYRPGAFFERELPCLLAVLGRLARAPGCVVVDGYVDLDAQGAPGLGAHLHHALGGATPVVGIAKTAFRDATFASCVLRGTSATPLYVTARGMDVEEAARLVASMHGPHRLPTLVVRADHLARGLEAARPT